MAEVPVSLPSPPVPPCPSESCICERYESECCKRDSCVRNIAFGVVKIAVQNADSPCMQQELTGLSCL